MKEGIGDLFQRETKYQRGKLPGGGLDWAARPETYKKYAGAPVIQLDPPATRGGEQLWDAISSRRSVRSFGGPPVTGAELSQLLWASQGISFFNI